MMNQKAQIDVNVGVDVGKSQLDIHLHPLNLHMCIPNQPDAIQKVVKLLSRHSVKRIVTEATGRYEHAFVFACDRANLPVVVVSPIKGRRFAQAMGVLAKTDKIDAAVIAQFAARLEPDIKPIPDKQTCLIKDLLVRRSQLLEMATIERNRRHIMPKPLCKSINGVLKALQIQIDSVTAQIDHLITQSKSWRKHKS